MNRLPHIRELDGNMLVAGQLRPGEMQLLQAEGVTLIVNNRPDGEQPGQPAGAEIETAAKAAGIDYLYLPVSGGFAADQIELMAGALQRAKGKTLAFCASGTRSTFLWALASASLGQDGETLIGKAGAAGYDLGPIRAYLLAASSKAPGGN